MEDVAGSATSLGNVLMVHQKGDVCNTIVHIEISRTAGVNLSSSITVIWHPEALAQSVAEAFAISAGATHRVVATPAGASLEIKSLKIAGLPDCPQAAVVHFRDSSNVTKTFRYQYEGPRLAWAGARYCVLPATPKWLALALAVVRQLGGQVRVEGSEMPLLDEAGHWPEDLSTAGGPALHELVRTVLVVSEADILHAEALLKEHLQSRTPQLKAGK